MSEFWGTIAGYLGAHPEVVLYALGGIWLLGLVLGIMKVIIVFRDFNDVSLVGLTVTVPAAIAFWLIGWGAEELGFLLKPLLWFEVAMAIIILVRTCIDNRNPLTGLLAFMVKMPIGIMFAFNVVDYFMADRRQDRRMAGFFILLLSGFVIALVANKRGFLAPDRLLRRHGISQREPSS